MSSDILEGFVWHSSIGIDESLGQKRFVTRMPRNRQSMSMFTAAGNKLLIHKTTRCLWKISDDNKSIEPVFSSDVLSDEDVKAAMEE